MLLLFARFRLALVVDHGLFIWVAGWVELPHFNSQLFFCSASNWLFCVLDRSSPEPLVFIRSLCLGLEANSIRLSPIFSLLVLYLRAVKSYFDFERGGSMSNFKSHN